MQVLAKKQRRPSDERNGNSELIALPTRVAFGGTVNDACLSQLDTMKVTVAPGDTLESLATDHLGSYNRSVLREIRALNPRITDPNHIETGRTLRLPAATTHRHPLQLKEGTMSQNFELLTQLKLKRMRQIDVKHLWLIAPL